ncbi:MAG: GNAT family N-acetyltransferase [Nitrospiraceae bacterium]|nr:GNAT family N-acetyltransferase [Nitrospiraceae bacterium]
MIISGTKTEWMGYAHPGYAESLREFGEPLALPRSGGWILVRTIPGTPYKDAMGCYPLFACRNWDGLQEDLLDLDEEIVSIVLVAEPLTVSAPSDLERCFNIVEPFKTHYVADLRRPLESFVDGKYRTKARRSLKSMQVEVAHEPVAYLDDWMRLYDHLIRRHGLTGLSTFSRESFAQQMQIPGMIMLLGRSEGKIVGATLVLIHDDMAFSHLTAFSERGYEIRASYGIYWQTLLYLSEQGVRFFNAGGSAGICDDPDNGLAKFKRGWSNTQRTAYLCGQILNKNLYELLCRRFRGGQSSFFPAYRSVEAACGSAICVGASE